MNANLLLGAAVLLVSCASSPPITTPSAPAAETASASTSATAKAEAPGTPSKRKLVTCPATKHMRVNPKLAGLCMTDDDCTQGRHARCAEIPSLVGPGKPKPGPMVRACVSDDCDSDSDCPHGSLCFCGTGVAGSNECAEGECRDNADCGGRECAQESWPPMPPSSLPPPRHTPLYCRTPQDQCKEARDCGGVAACAFHKDRRRFECLPMG